MYYVYIYIYIGIASLPQPLEGSKGYCKGNCRGLNISARRVRRAEMLVRIGFYWLLKWLIKKQRKQQ